MPHLLNNDARPVLVSYYDMPNDNIIHCTTYTGEQVTLTTTRLTMFLQAHSSWACPSTKWQDHPVILHAVGARARARNTVT